MFTPVVLALVSAVAAHQRLGYRDFVPTAVDLKQYVNQTVMFVGAHPDDLENCGGGTVALLTQQGP